MTQCDILAKPLLPMYIINWIFGIGVIEYPLGKPHRIISFIYSSSNIVIYCTLSAASYDNLIGSITSASIGIPVKILFYSHILLTTSTFALGWCHSSALRNCGKKIENADSLMEDLSIQKNCSKLMKKQLIRIFRVFILIVLLMSINAILIIDKDTTAGEIFLAISAISYPIFVMFIADATFVSIVRSARDRFIALNKLLKSLSISPPNSDGDKDVELNTANGIKKYNIQTKSTEVSSAVIIRFAKQIHLQLIKLCQEADTAYGLQILLSLAVAFSVITGNIYVVHLMLVDVHVPRDVMYNSLMAAVIWVSYYMAKIYWFSWICSCCMEESIKTGDIINKIYDTPGISNDTQNEIRDFNVQLIQRPLKFTAYGFINLDFTLVQGFVTSTTTYLMILIQLNKSFTEGSLKNNLLKRIFSNKTYT